MSLLMMGLATELWMLFVARTLAGVLSSATLPTTMAYVGDSTPEDDRGGGMGKLWAGALFDANYNYPYVGGAAILFLGFLISLALLPGDRKALAPSGLQSAAE